MKMAGVDDDAFVRLRKILQIEAPPQNSLRIDSGGCCVNQSGKRGWPEIKYLLCEMHQSECSIIHSAVTYSTHISSTRNALGRIEI